MINVYDFCDACAEATKIELSFYDSESDEFITRVVFNDAKIGCKTLSAVCKFATIESFYSSDDLICCRVIVRDL